MIYMRIKVWRDGNSTIFVSDLGQNILWIDYCYVANLIVLRIFHNARQRLTTLDIARHRSTSHDDARQRSTTLDNAWVLRLTLSNHFILWLNSENHIIQSFYFMHIIAVAIFSLQVFENLRRCLKNSIEFRRITN